MDPIPLGALGERGARRDVVPWAWRIVNRDGDRGGTEGGGAGGEEEEGDGETPVRWGAESHVLGGRVAREAERVPDHRAPRQGATAQPCSARAWRGSHRARQRGLPRRGKVGREEPGVLRWREWHPKCLHLSLLLGTPQLWPADGHAAEGGAVPARRPPSRWALAGRSCRCRVAGRRAVPWAALRWTGWILATLQGRVSSGGLALALPRLLGI